MKNITKNHFFSSKYLTILRKEKSVTDKKYALLLVLAFDEISL